MILLMSQEERSLHIAFGKTLRKRRMKASLSQEKLALACGLDRTYISLLERGLRQPSLTTLFQIAKSLGVAPSQIVRDVENTG